MAPTPTASLPPAAGKCPAYRTTAQCRRPRHKIILLLAPSPRRPVRGQCVYRSIRAVGNIKTRVGTSARPRGEGRGRVLASECVPERASGASGHTLRRVSEVRQDVCRDVKTHVKARVRGGCVRVSGVRQEVRRAHIGSIREGRRARERRPYCDIVIFFEKICFLGKKPYLCNASLDRFDPKIGHLF